MSKNKKTKLDRRGNPPDREVESAFEKLKQRDQSHQEDYQPKEKEKKQ